VLFAVVAVFAIGITVRFGDVDELASPESLNTFATIAMWVLAVMTFVYATRVFAREKAQRTAHALVLTGHRPLAFYLAKIWSLFWSLRYAYLVIAALIVATIVVWPARGTDYGVYGAFGWTRIASLVEGTTLGLLSLALIGMALSAAARSPWQALGVAVLAVLGASIATNVISIVTMFFLGPMGMVRMSGSALDLMHVMVLVVPLLLAMGGILLLCLLVKRWNAWLVGLVAALTWMVEGYVQLAVSSLILYRALGAFDEDSLASRAVVMFVISTALTLGLVVFWSLFGLRIFDRCMRGDTGRSPRRPALPTVRPVILLPARPAPGQGPLP